jgi:N-acetylmuramoyl-L-alanine amidase
MQKKPFYFIFSILIALILFAFIPITNKNNKLKTLILDAGHGGKDPGANCYSKDCNEAQITLGVTLKLGKILEKELPDVKLIYTRKDNSYPSLIYRADLANENKGDLFVSIHCNSASSIKKTEQNGTKTITYYVGKGKKRKKLTKEIAQYKTVYYPNPAKGLETYVWVSTHTSQKTEAIAAAENAEIFKDPDYKKNYGNGLDIKSPEFIAKAKLRTKKYFTRSTNLANLIQEEGANVGRNDRNVKQRGQGIWVLQATAMPSVLVETGYISNPEEAAYLKSQNGQQEMAEIVAKAIIKYKQELEKDPIPNPPLEQNIALNNGDFFIKPKKLRINLV